MSLAQPAGDRVWVAVLDRHALVRVQGRGSFKVSTALKQFAISSMEQGIRSLVMDMNDCVGMDSTFMGVLAGLAGRLTQLGGGSIRLVNLTPRTHSLLTTLGLDRLISAHLAEETPAELEPLLARFHNLALLETAGASQRTIAETMLEAHEKLVEISPDNIPKFKDVLTFLRADLEKTKESVP